VRGRGRTTGDGRARGIDPGVAEGIAEVGWGGSRVGANVRFSGGDLQYEITTVSFTFNGGEGMGKKEEANTLTDVTYPEELARLGAGVFAVGAGLTLARVAAAADFAFAAATTLEKVSLIIMRISETVRLGMLFGEGGEEGSSSGAI